MSWVIVRQCMAEKHEVYIAFLQERGKERKKGRKREKRKRNKCILPTKRKGIQFILDQEGQIRLPTLPLPNLSRNAPTIPIRTYFLGESC